MVNKKNNKKNNNNSSNFSVFGRWRHTKMCRLRFQFTSKKEAGTRTSRLSTFSQVDLIVIIYSICTQSESLYNQHQPEKKESGKKGEIKKGISGTEKLVFA